MRGGKEGGTEEGREVLGLIYWTSLIIFLN